MATRSALTSARERLLDLRVRGRVRNTPSKGPSSRAKTAVVVGTEPVRRQAVDAAERAGWIVLAEAGPPESWDGYGNGWLPRAPGSFEELLVEASLLGVVRTHGAELTSRARALRLIGRVNGDPDASQLTERPLVSPIRGPAGAAKRLIDLVLGAALLLASAPVLLLAMVAVRLESPGPAIYKQTRLGARGRRFTIYKLRTMYVDNDDSLHRTYVDDLMRGRASRHDGMFKLVSDPRVTKVGRLLRRFSLDEAPQLWNVVRGDMSLVGPRPPLPREGEQYDARAWLRLLDKPGLTCLWQVSGRCELPFSEQIELDLEYWRRWSLALDLQILVRTPAVVLTAKGAA